MRTLLPRIITVLLLALFVTAPCVASPERSAPESEEDSSHWAYVPPRRPALPEVTESAWVRTPVDRFVLARLEAAGVAPAPQLDAARLLRRLTLDLTGLPPTLTEVDEFLTASGNDFEGAYLDAVDRLLASPAFGEHWGRRWLDLARYADSNGFQRDGHRQIWAYRDWVIRAMNDDLPFDQFTIEQNAGDLLPNATEAQRVATGFHRCTTVNVEAGVDREQDRVNAVIDRVNTTGTVWLGTTLECAQCHDHKYDPFSQKEYFRVVAFFNNTEIETRAANGSVREFVGPRMEITEPGERIAQRAELTEQKSALEGELEQIRSSARTEQAAWEERTLASDEAGGSLPKRIRKILQTPASERNKASAKALTEFYLKQNSEIKTASDALGGLTKKLAGLAPYTTLVMQERDTPRTTRVFERGNFLTPGEEVSAGVPAVLHALPASSDAAEAPRLRFARWLASEENPLTARVAVNRWWAALFGEGLVATLEDFGTRGDRPSHPELLDWLATELASKRWSRKTILRLLVTSAVYRTAPPGADSPKTGRFAHSQRRRLDAETIRDNALAISGRLTHKLGGPPVYPPQPAGIWRVIGRVDNTYRTSHGEDRYRRGIYTVWRRSSPYPSFVSFDAPDRAACCTARPITNTPLQALVLLNDSAFVELAFAFAERLAQHDGDRLLYGFRLCVARHPTARELELLRSFHKRALNAFEADPQRVKDKLAGHAETKRVTSAGLTPVQFAALVDVASVLFNLDETITRP